MENTPEASPSTEWTRVAHCLDTLRALIPAVSDAPVDLARFAKGYAELAVAYVAAIAACGRTSMRVDAVLRALDLKTPKSALLRFLGRAP